MGKCCRFSKVFVLIISFVLMSISGCAVGNKYDLANSVPDISQAGTADVALGVHDVREYIRDNDKDSDFIGLQRGGFGNPFDVSTLSGNPLSKDIADSIAKGLSNKGYALSTVEVLPNYSNSEAEQAVISLKKDRSILVTIEGWKSDTMYTTALYYKLHAVVYDKAGTKLAENSILGRDNLGGSAWNPPAYAKVHVPMALTEKLDELIDDPRIMGALIR